MAQFYDQDNPHASYSRTSYVAGGQGRNANPDRYVTPKSNGCAEDLVRRSTSSTAQRDRARVAKAQQRKQQRQRRLAGLLVGCMIVGGVAVGVVGEVVDNVHDNMIVYEQTAQFRREVISPNTHRTQNLKYYYYDYDDIADAIMEDGKDFSTELYKAYVGLGEYQTNKVMKYTDYTNLEEYVKANGFEDIEAWADAEKEKIILRAEIDEKSSELSEMHRELNGDQVLDAVEESYMGGK